jgi:phage-related minor tail protein
MQNNRDSSVLRSLAIAFGDGLAFGVGMKLTQRGATQDAPTPSLEAPLPADMTPLLDRLAEIEGRLGKVERAPAAIASAPAPFDQKVVEAIVHALDARLREQSAHVERRLTELEAKLAMELKSLQQQDRSVVTAVQTHIEELNGQINDQLAAIRRRSDEERAAMQREIASLHREFAGEIAEAVNARTAELRTEIASRDSQIAEIQAQVEHGDEKLRNVVQAIAQACQTVGARKNSPPKAEPEPAAEEPASRYLPVPVISSLALVSAVGFALVHCL